MVSGKPTGYITAVILYLLNVLSLTSSSEKPTEKQAYTINEMTGKIHLPDQTFGARSPSCIQRAFLNSEVSSTESPQHTSGCIWAEIEDSSTPNNDGIQPLRLDFLFEPVLSLETDPFEQLAPSSPAR